MANTGPHPTTVGSGRRLFYSASTRYPDALTLLQPEAEPRRSTGRCWVASGINPRPAVYVTHELPSGAQLSERDHVVNEDQAACYPTGEYEFVSPIEVGGVGQVELTVTLRIDAEATLTVDATPSTRPT